MECGVCLDTKTDTEFTILPCTHKVCSECFPKSKFQSVLFVELNMEMLIINIMMK